MCSVCAYAWSVMASYSNKNGSCSPRVLSLSNDRHKSDLLCKTYVMLPCSSVCFCCEKIKLVSVISAQYPVRIKCLKCTISCEDYGYNMIRPHSPHTYTQLNWTVYMSIRHHYIWVEAWRVLSWRYMPRVYLIDAKAQINFHDSLHSVPIRCVAPQTYHDLLNHKSKEYWSYLVP